MDVQSTTSTTATTTDATQTAQSQLMGNYNSFLLLLTTQLKNQDPLAPLDATQFVSQLSQLASVEQAITSNQKLDKIVSALGASATLSDIGLIGRPVEVEDKNAEVKDGTMSMTYKLDADAKQAVMTIRDQSGTIIGVQPIDTQAGEHSFTWDGTDSHGGQMDDGIYNFEVSAVDSDGKPVTGHSYVTATVNRVETSSDGSTLVLSNGSRVASSAVLAVMQS
jgi:flagellar basal-body rod modification protein FlgD